MRALKNTVSWTDVQRISYLGGLVLIVLTLITGLAVFKLMLSEGESILSNSLTLSLKSRASIFQITIENRAIAVNTIATRPLLTQELIRFNTNPSDQSASTALQRGINSFLSTGFTALALDGPDGQEITHAGTFITEPALSVPVKLAVSATLMWKDEFIFNSRMPIVAQGKTIGFVRAQASLPSLHPLLRDTASLGQTGEFAICAPLSKSEMECFPTALHPQPLGKLGRFKKGNPLPMNYALEGQSGIVTATDYRNEKVVAAYQPLADTGLGLVLKIDAADLYRPVSRQIFNVLPALAVLIAFGVMALRWLVMPLVKKLAVSEQAANQSHANLVDKENRIRAIFENIGDGIVVINSKGVIEAANPSLEQIFGYTAQDVIGLNVSLLMPGSEDDQHSHQFQSLLPTDELGGVGVVREVTAVRKDGGEFPIELRATEMQHGEERLFVVSMSDITERKLVMAELTRRNQELNNFAYVASHDLKSPLRGIDQLATWLSDDLEGKIDSGAVEHLRLIRVRIKRMENLLDGLLAYARAGTVTGAPEQIDTRALLLEVFDISRNDARFQLKLEGTFPVIETAQAPLELVFRNLIGNAIKHHDQATGVISITARQTGNMVEFDVADDGPGIPAEHTLRAFAMFQTLRPRDEVEGSGIGLAIVKKTIEAFGGTIMLLPNSPRGALFRFTWQAKRVR